MTDKTEPTTPSAEDDIKSVLQDTLFQQVDTLLKFTRTETLQLQIPDTEIHIFAGPRTRIAEFIQCEIVAPAASFEASAGITPEYKSAQQDLNAAASAGLSALASQSQAAQPTGLRDIDIVSIAEHACLNANRLSTVFDFARAIERTVAHIAGTSQATKAQAEPDERTYMDDKQASEWAWEQIKRDVGTEGWTCGDSCNYFGFFLHGWRYGKQYERQGSVASVAKEAEKEQQAGAQANELMRKALEDIAQPANAGCGCSFPCQCNSDGAEVINAGVMRDIASDTLAEVERLCCAQREDKNAERSDLAPTTSTVSTPAEQAEGDFARLSRTELIDYINLLRKALDSVNFPAPSSTKGAPAAPEEVRNQALEEAAALAIEWANARIPERGGHSLRNCADAIRALRTTSTDQANADTDTGSAA